MPVPPEGGVIWLSEDGVSLWQIDWAKPIVPAARSEYTVILIEMLLTVAQFPLVTLRLNHVPEERAEGE
jgi:hypothetical protein